MNKKDYAKFVFSCAWLGLTVGVLYKIVERGLVEYLKDFYAKYEAKNG